MRSAVGIPCLQAGEDVKCSLITQAEYKEPSPWLRTVGACLTKPDDANSAAPPPAGTLQHQSATIAKSWHRNGVNPSL